MDEPNPGSPWPDWRAIGLLALVAVGLRTWQLAHTEVASRDSIAYIRIAWQLGHDDWRHVIPRSSHHPGYPVAVLAVSHLVRPFVPDDLPRAMQLSAQLASSLAGVLLVVPMVYLGRELFNRRIAFWTALLFQCLPAGGRVLGDGLSEGLFLLLATTSLTMICHSLRTGSCIGFGLAGLLAALAYLTRPEGAVAALAGGLVLLGMQAVRRWRQPWPRCLACGMSLTVTFLALAGPFMALIGNITLKNTGRMMLKMAEEKRPAAPAASRPEPAGVAVSPVLWAVWNEAVWDRSNPANQSVRSRCQWALGAMPTEFLKGYFYVWWAPVLLGLLWFRDRFRVVPGAWVVLCLCLILTVLMFLVAAVGGYLSDRHLLLILLCSLYWGVAAVLVLATKAAILCARWRPALAGGPWSKADVWALGLLVLLCAAPLGRTLKPLHADRAGFKEAGRWLAAHVARGDVVEDPYAWASYYAGRLFQQPAAMASSTCYIVLEEAVKPEPNRTPHRHLTSLNELEQRAQTGEVVCRWPVRRSKGDAEVRIYAVRN
jgi:hypothetical protein